MDTATVTRLGAVNFKCLGIGLPIDALLATLEVSPQLFEDFPSNIRNTFPGSPHQDTHSVLLRWCYPFNEQTAFNSLVAVDYPAAQFLYREVAPLVNWLLCHLQISAGLIGRAMVNRLLPNGVITPHADEGSYAAHYERFHICLQSDPGNVFLCGDEEVEMKPGEAWWFDHRKTHSFANKSERSRLHLIVDAYVPEFREIRRAA